MHVPFSCALLSLLFGCYTCFCAAQGSDSVYMLMPKAGPRLGIHGPTIIGVRPNHPVSFTIPATGVQWPSPQKKGLSACSVTPPDGKLETTILFTIKR